MRRIAFAAFGSRGDVQPMLSLALEVQRRGHSALLLTLPGLEEWLRPYGVPFATAGRAAREILSARSLLDVMRALRDDLPAYARLVHAHMEGVDTLVSTAVFPAAAALCEAHRARHLYLAVGPHVIDSDRYPVSGLPFFDLPRFANALSWRLNAAFWEAGFGESLQRVRREMGLCERRGAWEQHRGHDIILASDPVFGSTPATPGRRVTATGALTLADPTPLPGSLVGFIEDGPPPIFFGFGSMPHARDGSARSVFVAAARRLGRRAVILADKDTEQRYADDVYFTAPVDFDRLLPRCAAIVHHGGAGTTHAALRAGISQVIVPHLLDQLGWAHAVFRASLGPKAIARKHLDEERLARALEHALSAPCAEAARRAAAGALVGNALAADVVLAGGP